MRISDWSSDVCSSDLLARLAKDDPDRANALLPRVAAALGMDEAERARVLYQVARWTAVSYLPESPGRLAAVPNRAWKDELSALRVREELDRSDWQSALECGSTARWVRAVQYVETSVVAVN